MAKVIIAGSRDFEDYNKLCEVCDSIISTIDENVEIVSGTARGADRLGERYAKERGYMLHTFPAEWDKYGRSAGYRRNTEMAKVGTHLIAFWDGVSKGTKMMIDTAKRMKLNVKIYIYK